MRNIFDKKFLLAGYGLPAEFGLTTLMGLGVPLENITLLTYPEDERNKGLRALATLRNIDILDLPAKDPSTIKRIEKFQPDALISLHYRSLIPDSILQIPKLGGVNLHPSLLPAYRGTNTVAWVIINDEKKTGFTYHRMNKDFDTGNILLQQELEIYPTDTAFSLFNRQIICAMEVLTQVIGLILQGEEGVSQMGEGSYYSRQLPFDGIINPEWELSKIQRFIRAMTFPPFAPAAIVVENSKYLVRDFATYLNLANKYGLPIHT